MCYWVSMLGSYWVSKLRDKGASVLLGGYVRLLLGE